MRRQLTIALSVALTSTSIASSLLPNDMLEGQSALVKANPKDLLACAKAATKDIDGISVNEKSYAPQYQIVPLSTSMTWVSGTIQRHNGESLSVFVGTSSQHSNSSTKAFAAARVRAIVAGISRECGAG